MMMPQCLVAAPSPPAERHELVLLGEGLERVPPSLAARGVHSPHTATPERFFF